MPSTPLVHGPRTAACVCVKEPVWQRLPGDEQRVSQGAGALSDAEVTDTAEELKEAHDDAGVLTDAVACKQAASCASEN